MNNREVIRKLFIYGLLIVGAVIFSWPFVWMAMTSMKMDREMFSEKIRLFPQRPIPALRSPYVDERLFQDLSRNHADEFLSVIKERLSSLNYPWPVELDRGILVREAAKGVFKKLEGILPAEIWNGPLEPFRKEIRARVDEGMVREAVEEVRRCLLVGQLRVRSDDLKEDLLVSSEQAANAWIVGGNASARLVPIADPREPHAELHYDFSKGDGIHLSKTFTTSFPVEHLHHIQLFLRNDDSWHALKLMVEMKGKRYIAERSYDLSDYANWESITWQESGPDDKTNKIRTWILLREMERGSGFESNPHKMKITIEIRKVDSLGAWWAKIRHNYRLAFDYLPFGRYVSTSAFLIILNMVGTLLSCSLVAYSFARLQWPGRGFCFGLMLATMMIPGQVTMIPTFLIIRALGWYNTLYPLWIGSLFANAFNVFLLRQFFRGIPRDLEDAAKIDGCGFLRIYWFVMLPLIKPTLITIGIFTFMGVWNDFMGPLIYLNDQRLYPLSLGLYAFNVQTGGSMGMMMAGSLLMTTPVVLVFFSAQKYFIQGVALKGMKG